jgi:hypothetical protein
MRHGPDDKVKVWPNCKNINEMGIYYLQSSFEWQFYPTIMQFVD